jgi:hypothetical protein
MKKLVEITERLISAGRWDIDYHEPPMGIKEFSTQLLTPVAKSADIIRRTRNPTKKPDVSFQYVDIASVDVETGTIVRPQELTGEEAPSRARKVMCAYDIIISTCRPTRGAIAVVPEELHGQICSTGFSVIRAKEKVNPFYLHFVLRMPSTLEQFRKWSTGSSYPAILDEDIAKTLVPLPNSVIQDQIAETVRYAILERDRAIQEVNYAWERTVADVIGDLSNSSLIIIDYQTKADIIYSIKQVQERIAILGPIEEDEDEEEMELYEQHVLFPAEYESNGNDKHRFSTSLSHRKSGRIKRLKKPLL